MSKNALNDNDIKQQLRDLPDWKVKNEALVAEFEFKDFKQAMAFVMMVALESEKINHHPEWSNVWNKVKIFLNTHEAGDKITTLDIKLAHIISQAADSLQ